MTDSEPTNASLLEPPRAATAIDAIPPSARLNTWSMWLFVLSPAVQVVVYVVLTAVAAVLVATGDAAAYSLGIALDSPATTVGITVLVIAARVLLAWLDHRELARLGVPQPMPWGWGLLSGIYLIGRGVVLHRRVGRGAALTWIGLLVAALALLIDRSGVYDQVAAAILS